MKILLSEEAPNECETVDIWTNLGKEYELEYMGVGDDVHSFYDCERDRYFYSDEDGITHWKYSD